MENIQEVNLTNWYDAREILAPTVLMRASSPEAASSNEVRIATLQEELLQETIRYSRLEEAMLSNAISLGMEHGEAYSSLEKWKCSDGKDIHYYDQLPFFMKWLYNNEFIRTSTTWLGRLNRWLIQKLLLPFWGETFLMAKTYGRAVLGMPLIDPYFELNPSLKRAYLAQTNPSQKHVYINTKGMPLGERMKLADDISSWVIGSSGPDLSLPKIKLPRIKFPKIKRHSVERS